MHSDKELILYVYKTMIAFIEIHQVTFQKASESESPK